MTKSTASQRTLTAIAAIAALGVVIWGAGLMLDRNGLSERERAQTAQLVKEQLAAGSPAAGAVRPFSDEQKAEIAEIVKGLAGGGEAPVQSTPASTFSAAQKAEINRIFKQQLLSNPATLRQALVALEQFQQAEQQQQVKQAIYDNADAIFRSKYSFVTGNLDGKVTMVEFMDYNCPYCKRSWKDVLKLKETDPDLRIVMKEFPILGEGSLYASRAAIASRKQGLYWKFHRALMEARGRVNAARVDKIAQSIGIDLDKLKADMQSPDVAAEIAEGQMLAERLGIRGTPAFVIADVLIPGSLGFEALQSQIAEARKNNTCKVC